MAELGRRSHKKSPRSKEFYQNMQKRAQLAQSKKVLHK